MIVHLHHVDEADGIVNRRISTEQCSCVKIGEEHLQATEKRGGSSGA